MMFLDTVAITSALGGLFVGVVLGLAANRLIKRRHVVRVLQATREARLRAIETLQERVAPRLGFGSQPSEPSFTVERIALEDFKNIQHLELPLMERSSLEGNWTCIAGINGAGKTAILQALCIVLLGERYAAELGSGLLRRMIRRAPDGQLPAARIQAWIRRGDDVPMRITIPLNTEGIDEVALRSDSDYARMRQFWEEMKSVVLVSYGATRNLSQQEETRHEAQAKQVRRQMTLFDPLTRIADAEVLVKAGVKTEKTRRTLERLLKNAIGEDELRVSSERDRLLFGRTGAKVDAIDLPDGFRSTVAWLADLCAAWHDSAPQGLERNTDPSQISGIVLLDEIDLHLHPSMARSIVPRLRKSLPKVQFIVTTHSPLVLSSFDRSELVVLEADADGVVNRRTLDRQVFAFSMDEVYSWLMRTPPQSAVMEEKIARGDDPKVASYLYQAAGRSPDHKGVNAEEAELLVNDLERLLKEVKKQGGQE